MKLRYSANMAWTKAADIAAIPPNQHSEAKASVDHAAAIFP